MQRFRQPQKMQGPLFPIEDNELIDAINDYKNIPPENTTNNSQDCKPDITFDAENHMEVIEVDDTYMESNEYTDEMESEPFDEKNDKENIFKNIQKETEKTVNMFCKYYYFSQVCFILFKAYLFF